jgi:pyruvate kinase
MMNRIMLATEPLLEQRRHRPEPDPEFFRTHPTTTAVVYGAGQIADRLQAKLVVIATRSGATALAKSAQRDFVPTLGFSQSPRVLRRMSLMWGITPMADVPIGDEHATLQHIQTWGRQHGALAKGDRLVIVSGAGIHEGAHNRIAVHELA